MTNTLDKHTDYVIWNTGDANETPPLRAHQGYVWADDTEMRIYRASGNWDVYELLGRQPGDPGNVYRAGRYLRTDWRG